MKSKMADNNSITRPRIARPDYMYITWRRAGLSASAELLIVYYTLHCKSRLLPYTVSANGAWAQLVIFEIKTSKSVLWRIFGSAIHYSSGALRN